MKLESDLLYNFKMMSFHFEEAAYSHRCSKIEHMPTIIFKMNILETFFNNHYLLQIIIIFEIRVPNF